VYNAWTNQSTISYSWKESGKPSPRYIMLDTPVAISSSSLSSITQTLPVTPASDAVHAVLYSSNPLERGIVHKQGPPNPACPRENFADMNGVKEEFCDAWTAWAQTSEPKGFSTQQIFGVLFSVLVFVAMGVGAYLALAAVLRLYDVELSNVSSGLGKITAAVFKSLKQKAGDMRGMTSGLGGLVALSKGNMPSQMIQPETQIGTLTPIQIAKIEKANPDTSVEDAAKAAELKKKAEDEAAAAKAAELKKKAEDEAAAAKAAELKKKAEEEAAAAKAAAEKTAKENAAKQASEAKKAQAAAETERKRKEEEAETERKRKEEEAETERKRKEEEAETERKRKEEEAAQAAQAATPRKQSALEALRNRKGSIGELSPEGQAKTGLLKTPGLGRGRTKPGRGRVGSTRRVGY
jgi:hypothetical protein